MEQKILTKSLPEVDFLFHEDNVEVKKLLPTLMGNYVHFSTGLSEKAISQLGLASSVIS